LKLESNLNGFVSLNQMLRASGKYGGMLSRQLAGWWHWHYVRYELLDSHLWITYQLI